VSAAKSFEKSILFILRQQIFSPDQTMPCLRQADDLAQKMGKELGRSEILFG
jgi:hypothetical protein